MRLVLRRGFAGLGLTLGLLTAALPAVASGSWIPLEPLNLPKQTEAAPPDSAGPPADRGPKTNPPDQAPAYGARQPAPEAEADAPGNSENTPAETRSTAATDPAPAPTPESTSGSEPSGTPPARVRRRSVAAPDFSGPPADEQTPAPEPVNRPRRTDDAAGRIKTIASERAADFREALETITQPARDRGGRGQSRSRSHARTAPRETRETAAPAPAPTAAGPRPEGAEPEQPLAIRIVPRPLRRIVEVVPGELWAALGALALIALALAIWSWITARRARRLARQRATLLEEVGLLQAALLPQVPDHLPASVAYRPTDGPAAGGDFYEAFGLADGRTGMILGDVSGHGREALARTTLIRYTLRAYLEAGLEPREVVKVGGEALDGHFGPGFATVAVAVHDPVTGRFTYASAGHAPPIVVGPAAHEPVTACSAPPIGIDEPTGFRQSTFTLTEGSVACLYTDGLTEARRGGRMVGRAQIEEALAGLPADADAEALLDSVVALADEITDDMAVCLVRAPAGAPGDGARIEELEVDEREVGDSLEHFLRACGVALAEVPGILREAGEAARREGTATVRVRLNDFRPGVDVVPGNVVRLDERRHAVRL